MNFKKFQNLAKLVILPETLTGIDSWKDSETLFQMLIPKVSFKCWEEHYIALPTNMDRVNYQSFHNCVYTQLRNYSKYGKSYWDE